MGLPSLFLENGDVRCRANSGQNVQETSSHLVLCPYDVYVGSKASLCGNPIHRLYNLIHVVLRTWQNVGYLSLVGGQVYRVDRRSDTSPESFNPTRTLA